jgi:hypothetical protein
MGHYMFPQLRLILNFLDNCRIYYGSSKEPYVHCVKGLTQKLLIWTLLQFAMTDESIKSRGKSLLHGIQRFRGISPVFSGFTTPCLHPISDFHKCQGYNFKMKVVENKSA